MVAKCNEIISNFEQSHKSALNQRSSSVSDQGDVDVQHKTDWKNQANVL